MADKQKEAAMKHLGEVEEKKEKPAKRHVHKISFERAKGGGFVVHKEMRGGKTGEHEEDHHTSVASSKDAAHDHLDEAMGDQPDEGEGEAPGVGQDPAAAGPEPGTGPAPAAQIGQGM
jgi:hypothetical protein